MNFSKFKQLYGHSETGVKLVKVGDEIIRVDNERFTYKVMTDKDKRLLLGATSSKHR